MAPAYQSHELKYLFKKFADSLSPFHIHYTNPMLFITQLIYVIEGQEAVFDQFESVAIPTILQYNGRLLLRVRPDDQAIIEQHIDKPYEIHLVEFDSEQDFKNFMQDEERKKFLHLKEQSIKATVLVQGTRL
ncbi:DUF1330 domain-containing protein [Marinoscillum sp.]|uniref:DUF1330 domain-containing protein n=1 Tax=Marinoscillum sp. TaxID=2024838 RepID=UPI003BACFF52